MISQSPALIGGSVLVTIVIALVWFHLPLVPVLTGAVGAGLLLLWRARRVLPGDGTATSRKE